MAEQNNQRYKSEGSIENIKKQADRFDKLIQHKGNDEVVGWTQYLLQKTKDTGKTIALSSGFTELDFFMDGIRTGELTTISGYTGMGKSLFLKSLIRNFAIETIPTCIFCYEDSVDSYLKNLEKEKKDYPLFLPLQLKMGDTQWIEERIVEAKLKFNCRIFAVDHLHYLLDMGKGYENVSLKLGSIMRFLKRTAVEFNVAVFVVAHQSKPKDDMVEASLETIRDSGLISNESDNVIVVQRIPDEPIKKGSNDKPTYDQNYGFVKIEKARRTGTYRKRLTFQKKGDWFLPL